MIAAAKAFTICYSLVICLASVSTVIHAPSSWIAQVQSAVDIVQPARRKYDPLKRM